VTRERFGERGACVALDASEHRFRAIFETAAIGIASVTLDGVIREANGAFEQMLGHLPGGLTGKTVSEITHPDDPAEALDLFEELRRGERESYQVEKLYVRRDGSPVWGRVSASIIRDEAGAPALIVAAIEDVQARRAAEQQLREAEVRYRTLVEELPLITYIDALDERSSNLYTSPQVEKLLGYSPEEWGADRDLFVKLLHPEDRARVLSEVARANETGERFVSEYRLIARDGHSVWFRDECIVVRDVNGAPLYSQGYLLDITERREAEEVLRESEARFRSMADDAPVLIWTANPDGHVTFFSKTWLDFTGRSLEEELGDGWVEAVHPDDLDAAFTAYMEAIRAHRPYEAEYRLRRADGEYRWIFDRGGPHYRPDGALVGYIGVGIDVTEEKEARSALEGIVENSPLAIVTSDRNGLVTGWNPAAERLLGWTREEALGGPPPHFVPGDDEGFVSRERAHQGEVVTDAGAKRLRKDGSLIDVRYAKAPLRDTGGEVVGTMAILTDVSERKRAEEALHESEARFAAFMDNAQAVAYMKDQEGRYVYVNALMEQAFGRATSELLGKTDRELFGDANADVFVRTDDMVRSTGVPVECLEPDILPDGSTRYWLTLKFPFEDAAGRRYVGGVSIDVTERERAEIALRETTLALEAVVDSSPLAIATFDRDGCVTRWNGAAERMFGWTEDEVLGRFNPILPEGEEGSFRKAMELVLSGKSWRNVEVRRYTKNRAALDVSVSAAPLRDATGAAVGMIAIIADVTERKRVEAQLVETKQMLESIIEAAPLAVIIFDAEARVTSWNAAAQRIFGWTADEVLGRFNPTVVPGSEEDFRHAVSLALAGESWQDAKRRVVRKDGVQIEISAACAPVPDASGKPIGMVALVGDITHRRRGERRLAAQHAVTAALAESATPEEAGPRVIEELCQGFGWDVGRIWIVNRQEGILEPVAVWSDPSAGARVYLEASRDACVARGEGPVGAAWDKGEPVWSADLADDTGFPWARWIERSELRSALAVPFESGGETLGVLEFLARELSEPDEELLAMFASTGRQLGQFVRRAEADIAVREREERFRTLVANVPGTIYRCAYDADWTMEFMSDAIREISGYPASDFIGNAVRTYADLIHPDDRAEVARQVEEAVVAREPFTLEYRIVHASGDVRWVSEKGQPIIGPGGDVLWLDGAIFDVTEQKRVESDLAQTIRLLDSVVESLPVMLFLKGADDLRFARVNRAMEEIMGAGREELLGKDDFDMLPAEQARFFQAKDREVLLSGELVDIAEEPLGDRYLHTRKVPIFDDQGMPRYLLGISMDITEAKLASVERERLLTQLEEQNEQLRELDRLKDEFVALVSHELRTPLTSILGYLELVLEGDVGEINEEQEHFLRIIERNSGRLLRLVGDLLFVAQIEAGKIALERQDVDLAELARECVEAARPRATEKAIELVLVGDPGPAIEGDSTRLAQLLDNLVSNAIKFTPEGGRVGVTLVRANGRVLLAVSDNGMGISADEQQRLFQRFYRTEGATRQAIQGTGLGLTITKAIVEAHGGSISVESAEGEGTTFLVDLPAGSPGSSRS
jgi:PAS domain S-box-containing protein